MNNLAEGENGKISGAAFYAGDEFSIDAAPLAQFKLSKAFTFS